MRTARAATTRSVEEQLKGFLRRSMPAFKAPTDAAAWRKKAAQLRRKALQRIYLRGYPSRVVNAKPRVVWGRVLRPDPAYVIRKLRYEAYPGYWIPALLYESRRPAGRVPVVLNPNGHHSGGKAADYKQIRCINLARRGMIALNYEFLGMGELGGEAPHDNLAYLDLTGLPAVGLFYLAMKKGLDVLLAHRRADPKRVAMTGLSGGGWQTIVLSAMDPRITVSIPVAGYTAVRSRIDVIADVGDLEQNPPDLTTVLDYAEMTAMLAPRPALLILNEQDTCCFQTGRTKPVIYDAVRPTYRAFGADEKFEYHNNKVPGTHNYEADNRAALYRFLNKHFGLDSPARDIHSPREVLTERQLNVGLPDDQETVASLARKRARRLARQRKTLQTPAQRRALRRKLIELIRLPVYTVRARRTGRVRKVELYDLRMGPWTLPAAKIAWPAGGDIELVIDDVGRMAHMKAARPTGRKGTSVVVDVLGVGDGKCNLRLQLLLNTCGHRFLGVQAAQILAAAEFAARAARDGKVRLVGNGQVSSLATLVAAAVEPRRFRSLAVTGNFATLNHLIERWVPYESAQSVLCPGLLEVADVPQLETLLEGVRYEQPGRCVPPTD